VDVYYLFGILVLLWLILALIAGCARLERRP
jgi:hypothetical protein